MKDDNRRFDWGPPQRSGDAFKDFAVYILIILIFGLGIWLLLDTRFIGKKNVVSSVVETKSHEEALPIVINENLHNTVLPAKPPVETTVVKTPVLEIVYKNKAKYYVQLGAFEDEASAVEVMNFLTENSFSPILKSPDDQFEIYRVLVGPFDSEADADYRAEKLNELGLPSFVVEY
jgi:cell division septation protein DedD